MRILVASLLVSVVAGCAPSPGPGTPRDSEPAPPRAAGPKRLLAAIRGAPSSFALQRTQPPGTGGSIPGTDALDELVQAGLVHRNENRFQVGGNLARYQSPELDALIEKYATTIPRVERQQALAQTLGHQTERVTLLGLVYNVNPTMVADRLVNVRARSNRATEAWNAHEWDVR